MQHLSTLRSGAMGRGTLQVGEYTIPASVTFKPCQLRSLRRHVSTAHHNQRLNGKSPCRSVEFYDKLQNTVGGGKPKMRWFFGESMHP